MISTGLLLGHSFSLAMSRVLRFHILLFLRLIIVVTTGVKFSPDAHKFQVIPCFWPVLGLLRHDEQRAKQALAHVLCDMHDIKAMRTAEETPVFEILENRLRFLHPHQRLSLLSFLSRRGAPFPNFQQLVNFFAAPSSWGARSSSLPSNICPCFLHGCFLGSHLRDPWNTVFEDPGSFPSW